MTARHKLATLLEAIAFALVLRLVLDALKAREDQ